VLRVGPRCLLLLTCTCLLMLAVMAPLAQASSGDPRPPVTCTDQGACVVVAQQPGSGGSGGGPGPSDPAGATAVTMCVYPRGSTNVVPCFDPAFGWLNTGDGCFYRSIPAPSPGNAVFTEDGNPPTGDGGYYLRTCQGIVGRPPGAVAMVQFVVWLPAPPTGFGGAQPTPAILAARAAALLELTGPQIVLSPPLTSRQVVGLPTWMWTRVGATTWSTHSATAAVPGESVTATARAVSISWSMGDGSTVVCANPGTPYSSRYDAHQGSPTCGYTYRSPSSTTADGTFKVTGTTTWRVTWTGAGATGVLVLRRTSTVSVVVQEAEAVNQ
jgi:hypothetical protein